MTRTGNLAESHAARDITAEIDLRRPAGEGSRHVTQSVDSAAMSNLAVSRPHYNYKPRKLRPFNRFDNFLH